MPVRTRLATIILAVVALTSTTQGTAEAERGLQTGFLDGLFTSIDSGERQQWLGRAVDARAGLVRFLVHWRSTVSSKPASPANPADVAYDFSSLDRGIRAAEALGLDPVLTVFGAPGWAEGSGRPTSAPAGTWKPSPDALGDFSEALAQRYSGSFPDPGSLGSTLPPVRYYQVWNEPNLTEYLTPQWKGKELFAADHYRAMLNAAFEGVHDASPGAKLITGGTAPYGEPPGGARSRPLRFWREVFCLKDRDKLKPTACGSPAERAHFDIMAHHPINTSGPPTQSALHPDDASSADFGQVTRVLRKAEKTNGVQPGGHRPIWATEFWWESNPPDPRQGVSLKKHARYISESLYLIWKGGGSAAIALQLRDNRVTKDNLDAHNATGAYYFNGEAKPALQAYQFPFVADRKKKSQKVVLWGKAPGPGQVTIERRAGKGWKKLERLSAGSNRIFTGRTSLKGKAKLRAKAGGEKSLVWNLK